MLQWFRSQPVDTVHKDPKVTGSILATCKKGFLSGYEVGIVGSAISLGIVQLFNQLTTERGRSEARWGGMQRSKGVTLYMGPNTLLYHQNIPFVTTRGRGCGTAAA